VNRVLRLAWVVLRARARGGRQGSPLDPWRTPLRVLPNDLDLLRHMNNGVYLSLMDIGRVDMMVRSGGQRALSARGWYPVVVAESIRFRRSLQPWERFEIVTRVLGWDERVVYVEQVFERATRDGTSHEVVAEAVVVARFLARSGGGVDAPEIATAFGMPRLSPAVPDDVLAWARSIDVAARV
jgi:acyl-CoA thioesterase FadM